MKKLIQILLFLSSFWVPNAFAATTVISAITATNTHAPADLFLLDTSIGGGNFTSRTITGANLFGHLYGNAQGGAVTNLDVAVQNLHDNADSISGILTRQGNTATKIYAPLNESYSSPITTPQYTLGTGYAVPLQITGSQASGTQLNFTHGHTNFFDQYSQPFGKDGIDFKNVILNDAIAGGGIGDVGYVSAPGASGNLRWNEVCLSQFLIGACVCGSDSSFRDINCVFNSVGLVIAPFADISDIVLGFSPGNTNAIMECVGRSCRIFGDVSTANIGVVLAAGDNELHVAQENVTNCAIAIGYPTNWPFTITNNNFLTQYAGNTEGNNIHIGAISAGYSYGLASSLDYTHPFSYSNSAYMKVWNTGGFGGARLQISDLNNEAGVISYTAAGDSAPYEADFFNVGQTNLFTFSNGDVIGSQDGYLVEVNHGEHAWTHNTLEYSRETNGALFNNGTFTNLGITTLGNDLDATQGNVLVVGQGASAQNFGLQIGHGAQQSLNSTVFNNTYPSSTVQPDFSWESGGFYCGIGVNNFSDATIRIGATTIPVTGSGWFTFGAHPVPVIVDSSSFGIGVASPTDALDVAGNIAVTTAGNGLMIKKGSNAKIGLVVMNGSTPVVVANTSVTANSKIFFSLQGFSGSGTVGVAFVSALTPGTSFAVQSSQPTDSSTNAYLIVEATP